MLAGFRIFFETDISVSENEAGAEYKEIKAPMAQGSSLNYHVHEILPPNTHLLLHIPEKLQKYNIRDIIIGHRKYYRTNNGLIDTTKDGKRVALDPQTGTVVMTWEEAKSKWRDHFGCYTAVDMFDKETGEWIRYFDKHRVSNPQFKYAEPRRWESEIETLHDIYQIKAIKADKIRIYNAGNIRAKSPEDRYTKYSTVELDQVKIMFFNLDAIREKGVKKMEKIYSREGKHGPTTFIDFGPEGKQREPLYGHHGEGKYHNAFPLVAKPHRQYRKERPYVLPKKGSYNFPVAKHPGENTRIISHNSFAIQLPPNKKFIWIEIMCGDADNRGPGDLKYKKGVRDGFARLFVVLSHKDGRRETLMSDISVAPTMVVAAHPREPVVTKPGDEIIITSEKDTTYIMGWRIWYK